MIKDKKLTIGTDKCKCSVCGKYFNSTYAFDKHRTGPYGWNTRRCYSTIEMEEIGMVDKGYWVGSEMPPDISVRQK